MGARAMMIISAFVLLSGIAYWILKSGKRRTPVTVSSGRKTRAASKYHAVSIHPGSRCCYAVQTTGDKRFLTSGRVPPLPLANCNSGACTCKYVRHEDRRTGLGDRRAAYGLSTELFGLDKEKDRRTKQGRRAADWAQAASGNGDYADIQWTS